MSESVKIAKIRSGVPGLDEILGGGLPEYSFNLIAGGPGCGKTTLAHQILFANASEQSPALYVTVVGEPAVKMLRYQQQYTFFDGTKVPHPIRFLHLGEKALSSGLEEVLQTIIQEVEKTRPRLVIVDSFRSLFDQPEHDGGSIHRFVQKLSLHLTSWEATTFLVGEYPEHDAGKNPIFTVADGIVWLSQSVTGNAVVRKLQVVKMRGQGELPGLHSFRISSAGLRVFPRLPTIDPLPRTTSPSAPRKSTGVAGLDEMLGGGLPSGHSALVVGPSGSGKSMLCSQFLLEGMQKGENTLVALFERRPADFLRTTSMGPRLEAEAKAGRLTLLYQRPLDLSVEETLESIRHAVVTHRAERVVIDSLNGLELALAPDDRKHFREALYRMMGTLGDLGVTVMMTAELDDRWTELRLSPHGVSFLSDTLILQRYMETGGQLRKVMGVVKMRGSEHLTDLREYHTRPEGLVVAETLGDHEGILAGTPRRDGRREG